MGEAVIGLFGLAIGPDWPPCLMGRFWLLFLLEPGAAERLCRVVA